jgi:hypothetical protein
MRKKKPVQSIDRKQELQQGRCSGGQVEMKGFSGGRDGLKSVESSPAHGEINTVVYIYIYIGNLYVGTSRDIISLAP